VYCYEDDAQIREVRYRRATDEVVGYAIRLWELELEAEGDPPESAGSPST
jgi:hypothetical protein